MLNDKSHWDEICFRLSLKDLFSKVVGEYVLFYKLYADMLCVGSWWGNRRERDHWGDLGVDGWIILGWIFGRWDVGIWTGLGWPRIETGGGRL